MTTKTKKIIKAVATILTALIGAVLAALGLQGCNVTRVITNKSEFTQRGDTAVMIQTKTIETYDAIKH